MKKIIFLLLILISIHTVSAEEQFGYRLLSDGTAEIMMYRGSENHVIIPSYIDGIKVTSIGETAFGGQLSLLSVTIPDTVTSIGEGAFVYCSDLISVTIPDSVVSIGAYAFQNCSSLESITIPVSLKSIGERAFENCISLTSLSLSEKTSIGAHAFEGCPHLVITASQYAETEIRYLDFTYTINIDGTVEITGYTGKDQVLNIPAEIEGRKVTSIGLGAFYNCDNLTSVIIPNGITSISRSAFVECSNLASIIIPDSVNFIGGGAFAYCSDLTVINIPKGVTTIEDFTFDGCIHLPEIIIPEGVTTIKEHAFNNCSALTSVIIPDSVTFIGEHAFSNCVNLISVVIPDSVTAIGSYAFDDIRLLVLTVEPNSVAEQYAINNNIGFIHFGEAPLDEEWSKFKYSRVIKDGTIEITEYLGNDQSVVIPSMLYGLPVSSIGVNAFSDNYELTSVIIPDTVTTIKHSAFSYCTNLLSVTIPDSVTTIGGAAFSDCSSLKSVNIPDSVTTIENSAFSDCSSLTTVEIAGNITSFGAKVFAGCKNLSSITFVGNLPAISESMFEGDSNLANITIPDGVTTIGKSAFKGCTNLASVSIPESVTSIGNSAFEGCQRLSSVTIPDSVTSIGVSAFTKCINLSSVSISDSLTSIQESVFENCSSLKSVTIPDSVTSIGKAAFAGCKNLSAIEIPDKVTSIGNKAFAECSSLTAIIIPDGITSIDGSVFSECKSLESVTIPDSVLVIGDSAFEGNTSLKSIVIPDSVTSIGKSAFAHSGLTSIIIPDSVTFIGDYAFCGSDLRSITLPKKIRKISYATFWLCFDLKSVTIPSGVKSISFRAFEFCPSLESVIIPPSVTEIAPDSFNDSARLTLTVSHNSEGERHAEWFNIPYVYGDFVDELVDDVEESVLTADDEPIFGVSHTEADSPSLMIEQKEDTNVHISTNIPTVEYYNQFKVYLKSIGTYAVSMEEEGMTDVTRVIINGDIDLLLHFEKSEDNILDWIELNAVFTDEQKRDEVKIVTDSMLETLCKLVSLDYDQEATDSIFESILSGETINDNGLQIVGQSYARNNMTLIEIEVYYTGIETTDNEGDTEQYDITDSQLTEKPIINIEEPVPMPVVVLPSPTPAKSYLQSGDVITFGRYEQNNKREDGMEPIEWKVLTVENGQALLLSTIVLDAMPFNTGGTNSWDVSSLREWIQGKFIMEAFTYAEQGVIKKVSHKAAPQDAYPDTDTIFILSREEIQRYLPYPSDRQFAASSFAISHNVYRGENGLACWWTRTFFAKGIAYNVWSNGDIDHGDNVTANDGGVLPALWIDINGWMQLP